MSAPVIPRKACSTVPLSSSCWATSWTVLLGTAKPIPTEPPPLPPVAIWEVMPITRPEASISGPPELPGLIGASVWIASLIEKPFGDWISRWTAETIPAVAVRSSPNGLPIATTGSPTRTWVESAERHRVKVDLVRVDLEHREVGRGVAADELRLDGRLVAELDLDLARAGDDVGVGQDVAVGVEHEARTPSRCRRPAGSGRSGEAAVCEACWASM